MMSPVFCAFFPYDKSLRTAWRRDGLETRTGLVSIFPSYSLLTLVFWFFFLDPVVLDIYGSWASAINYLVLLWNGCSPFSHLLNLAFFRFRARRGSFVPGFTKSFFILVLPVLPFYLF